MNKFAGIVNSNKYIASIKDAFYSLIPIIITGAFATLFSSMVFDDKQGLAQITALHWLVNLQPIAKGINYATLSFFTIYAVFLIGIEMGKKNHLTGYFPGIVALMSYVCINPNVYNFITAENKAIQVTDVFAKQYTDTKGLFLGMLIAIVSVQLYTWLSKQKFLQLKMPDTVPSNVSKSFSELFPTMITVGVISTIGLIITLLTNMSLFDIIYSLVQKPLQNVVQGLPGILLLMLVAQLFWVIGIHGNQMIKPIREPLLIAAIAANTEAHAAGRPLPNIITMPFWDMYMSMGGSGVTIGLLIAIFLVTKKRADIKAIAKLSLAPGIFNINEPLIFGLPIVLNPILAIPFIFTPLITGTIGYFATMTGFAARAYVYTPWPTPPLISGFLATGGNWGAVITQTVCIVISVLIYLPFVKISESQKAVVD
ncbi:PTS sugar transporter subunit IIC [uncultured Lactobacillus sp.]|uniref:PTS sugar transporter subunit IIC n=1 Tax=uncultured Lactobacillus sp. TaxID=153152 RepID=UPI0025DB23CA|nr:PTS transporter subunit EIIC [uncultured Lactobacillus sp.]